MDSSSTAIAAASAPTSSRSTIKIADSDPLSNLQRPPNNSRRHGETMSLTSSSSQQGGVSSSTAVPTTAPIIDATRINNNNGGGGLSSTEQPVNDATVAASGQQQQQQQQQNRRRPSMTHIEGMDQLDKPVMDDGSSNDFTGNYKNMTEAKRRMKEEELSFYSASDNDHGDDNIWGLLSGVGGNIYEWYDFAVYGLLAAEIGHTFFPQSSKELQLVNSFGVYLAAFVMRPIGAIMFGEIGDRIVGRKNALVFSILLITIPSVLMGMLPGYDTWGWMSPILLVLLRMLQGLSVGGQLAGSFVITIEQSSSKSRGFRGSVCDASSVGGFLLASLVTSCVRFAFTAEQVDEWAWRLPFLFSLLLAPMLYHVVNQTEESKFWAERNEQKEIEEQIREAEAASNNNKDENNNNNERPAIFDLLSSPFQRRQLVGMVGVLSATTSTFYILFLWTPLYLSELNDFMTQAHADSMNFMVVAVYIVFLLVFGRASDTFPHRKDLMYIGLPGIVVACPAMFSMFQCELYWGYFVGQIVLAFCLAMVHGGMAAFEVELWMADPTLSFTGVAVGHNFSATLFGGTMPLVATALYYKSIDLVDVNEMYPDFFNTLLPKMLPGLYISLLAIVSLLCISCIVKHPHDVRTGCKQLQEAVKEENRRFKASMRAKKKKRQNIIMEEELMMRNINTSGTLESTECHHYQPPTIT